MEEQVGRAKLGVCSEALLLFNPDVSAVRMLATTSRRAVCLRPMAPLSWLVVARSPRGSACLLQLLQHRALRGSRGLGPFQRTSVLSAELEPWGSVGHPGEGVRATDTEKASLVVDRRATEYALLQVTEHNLTEPALQVPTC